MLQVCKIVEGQRYSKRLNERQITNLLRVTCQHPQERERDIIEVMSNCIIYLLYFCPCIYLVTYILEIDNYYN